MDVDQPIRSAFAIFITTICEGTIPAWYDEQGWPVTYQSEREAQLEIVDDFRERLLQLEAGERDFDDAMCVEEFILPVDVWPDGSIIIQDGAVFTRRS